MTKLTYGSLFSGIGCFDLAAERAGWECRWQCELDRDARRVLARHWPQVERHEDITQINPATLPPVDLIIGGFPCQSLSVAGKRAGFKDRQKSGLFHEMVRIIETVRPAFVLWENVPGLLSGGDDEDEADLDGIGGAGGTAVRSVPWMATVLGEFRRIGYRHGVWRMLDGRWWVPQRRRRIFGLFACGDPRNRIGLAASKPWEEPGGLDELLARVLLEQGGSGRRAESSRESTDKVAVAVADGTGSRDRSEVIADVFHHVGNGRFRRGNPSLAASDDNRSNHVVVIRDDGILAVPLLDGTQVVVRRLTPTECLRLQGLPDDWLDLDDGGKPLSDSAKYRMIGNGGVVPCVQWILDRLRRCVTGCNTEQNSPDLD